MKKSVNKCKNCKRVHKTPNIFCTKSCREEHRQKVNLEKVKKGILKDSNRGTIKKVLLNLRGHSCEICKKRKWQGNKIPLILDHIDGSHENNKLGNLRLVCPNCDAQLPTYKGRNKGNGRKERTLAHYKERFKNED